MSVTIWTSQFLPATFIFLRHRTAQKERDLSIHRFDMKTFIIRKCIASNNKNIVNFSQAVNILSIFLFLWHAPLIRISRSSLVGQYYVWPERLSRALLTNKNSNYGVHKFYISLHIWLVVMKKCTFRIETHGNINLRLANAL